MACRSNGYFTVLALVGSILWSLSGCISYQYERRIEGVEIKEPGDVFLAGKTTIGDVLSRLGAPDGVDSLDNTDLLIYRRSLYQQSGLSIGFPVLEVAIGVSPEIAARGGLARYDTLRFWFNSQGTLQDVVFEKASDRSYLKTLYSK